SHPPESAIPLASVELRASTTRMQGSSVLPHDDELVLWLTSRAGPYIEKFVMTYNKSQSEIVQSECEIKSDEALDDKLCPLRPDAAFNTEEFDEMHFLTYYELTYWVESSGVESIKRSLIFNTKTRDVTRRSPWVTTNTAADTRSYHYTYDYHPKQPLDFMWCQKPSNAASFKYTGCDEVNDVNNTLCFYDETCYSSYCKFYGVIEFDAALNRSVQNFEIIGAENSRWISYSAFCYTYIDFGVNPTSRLSSKPNLKTLLQKTFY
ncbi:uncharacterized protein LOC142358262, partial [Convolutriloba macropyga]|uniref:uncharacterized protein LOC142358262 n=1 Tax=Convolutriloba macropyga TaxID=536237 RepID=UPI003F5213D1